MTYDRLFRRIWSGWFFVIVTFTYIKLCIIIKAVGALYIFRGFRYIYIYNLLDSFLEYHIREKVFDFINLTPQNRNYSKIENIFFITIN